MQEEGIYLMKDNKKEWWKILLLIVASGFFDMVLHALISSLNSSNISSLKPSIFVENGMLIPAVICWELLAFGILAVVFVFIQDKLPGKRQIKGLFYGLPFAGLYLIGMFESALLFGSSVFNEFLMGLGDHRLIIGLRDVSKYESFYYAVNFFEA